jgi:hypothetical protein
MENWFNFYTLVAFVLGVLLSVTVKGLLASVSGKVKGATG